MELKYPKLSSGIKLVYASWWCMLLGAIVGLVGGIATLSAEAVVIVFVELAALVLELLVYGLQVPGLYKAGKDDARYKKLFFMLIAELLIAVAVFAAVLSLSYELIFWVGVIGGLACAVLEPLRYGLFVKYTEELVRENGDAGVAGYYKAIRNCFFICYGGIIIGSIITAMEFLGWLGVLLIIVAFFSGLAVFILYGIFLRNTNRFFKDLKQTEQDTSEEVLAE